MEGLACSQQRLAACPRAQQLSSAPQPAVRRVLQLGKAPRAIRPASARLLTTTVRAAYGSTNGYGPIGGDARIKVAKGAGGAWAPTHDKDGVDHIMGPLCPRAGGGRGRRWWQRREPHDQQRPVGECTPCTRGPWWLIPV